MIKRKTKLDLLRKKKGKSEGRENRNQWNKSGTEGFEPPNNRIKTCCLTAWPRPIPILFPYSYANEYLYQIFCQPISIQDSLDQISIGEKFLWIFQQNRLLMELDIIGETEKVTRISIHWSFSIRLGKMLYVWKNHPFQPQVRSNLPKSFDRFDQSKTFLALPPLIFIGE